MHFYVQKTLVNLMIITNKNMCLADVTAQPAMTTISSDKGIDVFFYYFIKFCVYRRNKISKK